MKNVEIVKYGPPEKIVKVMGPMNERKAILTSNGAERNLNHKEYFVRIVDIVPEKQHKQGQG